MNATSALGWALLHFVWQGILIALLARLVLALIPRRRAPVRYAVAVGALVLMPATVAVSIARAGSSPARIELAAAGEQELGKQESPPAPAFEAPLADLEAPARSGSAQERDTALAVPALTSWKQRVDGVLPWIVGAWAAGVLALAVRLLAGYTGIRRLVRAPGEPVPEMVEALLQRLAVRLRVRRAVRVCSSSRTLVPAVAGWLAPVVLLPASALSGLSRAQLEAVLAHELAHVKRHDYLVNLFQALIETLLFYHPAVWWLGARIREEREHCCDDLAVAACGSAPDYAEALLSMERLRSAPALAVALSGGSLLERVERLLAPRPRTPELFPRWIAGMSAFAIVFLFVATSDLAAAAQGRKHEHREQVEHDRTPQVPMEAREVVLHPDPSQTLASRNDWSRRLAAERGYEEYWVGHTLAPLPAFAQGVVIGRFDSTPGVTLVHGEDHMTFTGKIHSVRGLEGLTLPGVPLAPLVRADPMDVAVLYLLSARSGQPALERVHLATASLPVDFEDRPLVWLGRASDEESLAVALAWMDRSGDEETRQDLVGIVGAHSTSALVVPELIRMLDSKNKDEEFRGAAAEWLACHPVMDALRALERAARGDRSESVQCEAAEAVGEMQFAPAFDVLVALAHELRNPDARREAVESLGERTEPGAVSALLDIANGDPDEDIQREAAETLGDLPDGAGVRALSALAHSHPRAGVRQEAVETYGECAPAADALAFLRHIAGRDRDADVRREAVETIGEVHDMGVVEILAALAEQGDDGDVQREAVETLGETVAGAAVAPVLERIARRHPAPEVRCEAVETLGELHDEAVVEILAALAEQGNDVDVQREAVETLGETVAGAAVAPVLERIARRHPALDVRREAAETLGELHDERVVEILAALAEEGDDVEIQREAVETLGETVAGAAVAPVLERIANRHRSIDVQREAVETLGELPDEDGRVLAVLTDLASGHPSVEIRVEAVETLEDCCPPEGAAALFRRLLKSERSERVRSVLEDALEDLR